MTQPPILMRAARLFIDELGHTYPVTKWFDADGDETDDHTKAVSAAAGEGGCWFTLDLHYFPEETVQ